MDKTEALHWRSGGQSGLQWRIIWRLDTSSIFSFSFSFSFSVIFSFSFSVYSTLPSKCSSGSLMFSGSRFSGLEVSQDCSGDTLHSKVVSLEDTAIRGAGFKLYTAPAQLLHNSYTLRAVSPSPRSIKTTVRLVEIVQIVIWRSSRLQWRHPSPICLAKPLLRGQSRLQ